MIKLTRFPIRRFLVAGLSVGAIALPAVANADVYVRVVERASRVEVSEYAVEVEPHFAFGAVNVYGVTGFGGGCPPRDSRDRRAPGLRA